MKFHVFGDSHSAYCFECLSGASIHWLGPVTMHRIGRSGVDFVAKLTNDISLDDAVLFVFGEIDIRCHIIPISVSTGKTYEDVIEDLAERYTSRIEKFKLENPSLTVVISEPLFPANTRPNVDLPFCGSIEDRIKIHRILGNITSKFCNERGLLFLRMPNRYRDPLGKLKRKYSDDGVHIMPCEAYPLIRALGDLTKKNVAFRYQITTIFQRRWNFYFGGTLRRKGKPRTKIIKSLKELESL